MAYIWLPLGNFGVVARSTVSVYRHVEMHLDKIDKEEFGVLTVKYQNACFNKLGFLVHDTAV